MMSSASYRIKTEVIISSCHTLVVLMDESPCACCCNWQKIQRVLLETNVSANPIQDALSRAQSEVGQNPRNGGDIVMLGRNSQISQNASESCLGMVADTILGSGVQASLLVIQARGAGME